MNPPVTLLNAKGRSPIVLLCEHASNGIPARYGDLGLPTSELSRHIAWDIGAADLARALSLRLDAPLFLAGASRLLIDLNRPPGTPTSIPTRSEATEIPGNRDVSAAERAAREATWFHPFHDAVTALLDHRTAAATPTRIMGVHSFTPTYLGVPRPWHAGILFGAAEHWGRALVTALAADPALVVAENEPYAIEPGVHDHTVPVHGDARGLDAVLLEVRQDLLGTPEDIAGWADRVADAIRTAR